MGLIDGSNTQNTESITGIVENIEKQTLVLPEFQRDFVWDINKTYELFDSLIREVFIGSIIYGIPTFGITVREMDSRPRKQRGKRRTKLSEKSYSDEDIKRLVQTKGFRIVLDGQQRLTSIYRAIKGIDDVWIIVKRTDELAPDLLEKELKDIAFEDILYGISGNEDIERLSIRLSDANNIIQETLLDDEVKYKYFNKLQYIMGLDQEARLSEYKQYNHIVKKKLGDLLKSEKLVSYFLLDMDTEKFALFFERSNSLGIKLSFIDILSAKLYTGFKLRKETDNFEANHPEIEVEIEIIIRAIAYFVGKRVDKKYILSELTASDMDANWLTICEHYVKVLRYLSANRLIANLNWMPHKNMIIPLISFVASLPNADFSQMNENQKRFIHYWYWASIFAQRYAVSTNDIIVQDAAQLGKIACGAKINDANYFKKLAIQIEAYEDIYSYTKQGSGTYKGVLNLINHSSDGIIDWNNTSVINFHNDLDDHHIFPVAYLKSLSETYDSISDIVDCVANRTLIPKITNIQIGKSSPSTYLKKLACKNSNLRLSLEKHFIPKELIDGAYDTLFDVFIEERAKAIFKIIESLKEEYTMICALHFEEIKRPLGGSVKVIASYEGNTIDAIFDINAGKILFEGRLCSVSEAASSAIKKISGKESYSINGWLWWKYHNEQTGELIVINELRNVEP